MPQQGVPGRFRLVSTRNGVERALVLGFLAMRTACLIQAIVGVTTHSLASPQRPVLPLVMLCAIAVESVVIGVWLYRRGGVGVDRWPLRVDVVTTVIALAGVAFASEPAALMAPWGMGVYGASMSTAVFQGLVVPSLLGATLAAAGLAAVYFTVVSIPLWGLGGSGITDAATNCFAYVAFAAVAWLFARIARDLADVADEARDRVAELERERSRATVHDLLPFLRPELFAEADEPTRALLVQQAQAKYRQMRAFVDGTDHPEDLDTHLRAVIDLHPRLSVRAVFDLERAVRLAPDVLERLLRAVDTALANVEQHAPDARVVVNATSGSETVTATIRDDGPGFDCTQVTPGYGIAYILGRQLHEIGGHAIVTSEPGAGTDVCVVVPRGAG